MATGLTFPQLQDRPHAAAAHLLRGPDLCCGNSDRVPPIAVLRKIFRHHHPHCMQPGAVLLREDFLSAAASHLSTTFALHHYIVLGHHRHQHAAFRNPPSSLMTTSTSVRVSTTAPTPTAHANDARHFFAPPPFNSFHRKRSPPPPKNSQTASSRPTAHSVVRYCLSPQWPTPCYRRQHRSSHVPAAQTLITLCRHCPSFIREPTLAHLRPCLRPPTNPRLHPWAYSLGGPAHMPHHPPVIICVCLGRSALKWFIPGKSACIFPFAGGSTVASSIMRARHCTKRPATQSFICLRPTPSASP